MRLPLLWRRSATAAGIYLSVVFGFLATVLSSRQLTAEQFGHLSEVIVTAGFFQTLLDFTAEEALVKYGFDYQALRSWGRLRRLFAAALQVKALGGLAAAAVMCAIAPFADTIFGTHGLETPLLIAAALPFAQSPEGVSSAALILRSRYDIRAWLLACSLGLRLAGLAIGAHYGVTEAVVGLVVSQAAATVLLGLVGWLAVRRFPAVPQEALAEDRRGIVRFVVQSSLATGVVSLRGTLAPILLGVVSNPTQVGYYRVGVAPQGGFASLSAPARLILMTEQTRDWSRGQFDVVFRGVRRYMIGATLLMAVLVPPLAVFMPDLIRIAFGTDKVGATDTARLVLIAAALQVIWGWSKSLPVSVGRPGLRIVAHAIESAVQIPLVVAFGVLWGATGAGGALLVSTVVFCVVWSVLLERIRRNPLAAAPSAQAREAVVS